MMKYILTCLVFLSLSNGYSQGLQVDNLSCEYRSNPMCIEIKAPHLSWILKSDDRGIVQSAYRILVADDSTSLQKNLGNIWDSKKVNSNLSIQVSYNGKALLSTKTYYWKVMVWDNKKHCSPWSKVAKWQMGLLAATDWKGANWIAYETMPDSYKILPALSVKGEKKKSPGTDILPLLRKSFMINKPVKSATLFISGLGHFEMNLNGNKVGDHFLDAGWVNYQKQALYVCFDLTNQLKQGENAIGVLLGNGMYFTPSGRYRKFTTAYGYPKMICRLLLEYQDGTSENIISDTSWKTTPGPITFSAIYGGEDFNATLEQQGWDQPSFDDKNWKNAMVVEGPPVLNAQDAEPLKFFEQFSPQKITQPNPGVWVYDLGQNASGIPQVTVQGKRGDTLKITPAELINSDGTANQNATGKSYYYTYILKSNDVETWQPRFTYYGFRYLQIQGGVPQQETNPTNLPRILALKCLHTRNAAGRVGSFTCSNDLFNRTSTLIDWAIQSNMASVLTDCPHREKLGWLEEDHLMGNSIQYNYNIATLCKKIINDMKIAQTSDGLIPEISPEFTVFGDGFRDSPEWGSNCIILPWYVYQWYGDKQVLTESFDMMKRYIDYLDTQADHQILMQGLGDWYDIGPNRPGVSQLTPKGLTATAFYYYDLGILVKIAHLLGKENETVRYEKKAVKVKQAFNEKFFDKVTKQYGTGSQTANAIAVYMKLVDSADKDAVVKNIVMDLRNRNYSLTAGDIGYRYLLEVLDDEGRSDVIFNMNNRSDVPGYGYQLAKGATALTESWQAYPSVSNNHLMLGHIMEWFYAGIAGIKPAADAVAYNKIIIRPEPVGDVTFAKGSYLSGYGLISSEWKKQDHAFELSIEIPVNTSAQVYLPTSANAKITESGKVWHNLKYEGEHVVMHVGSGIYHFKANE